MAYDLSLPTALAATISIIGLVYLFQILIIGKKASTGKKRYPPQADGAWPIIGHLHLLGGPELPHKVLAEMADKHGPIFTVKIGLHQALVVNNAELAKECFTTNDRTFASRPKLMSADLIGYKFAMIGLAPYGQHWRGVRKIANTELLSEARIDMLLDVRVTEVRTSVREAYEEWIKNKENGGSGAVQLEMKQWFGNLVLNVVVRMIWGKRYSLDDKDGARFRNAVRKFLEFLGAFVVSDSIPFLKFLDVGGYEKAMKMTATEMDNFFQGWLEEHKKERSSGRKKDSSEQVFMDVMLSLLENFPEEDFPGYDRDTVIKATCLALLSAGSDTTTITLVWTLSLLLNNPESLKRVQREIDEHVGKERLVEESDIKNLVYLQAVAKESMRLFPGGPLSLPHYSLEECIVGGYTIPKGTRLLTNIYKIHRDPNVWSDPSEYRPERFLTTHKHIDVRGQQFEFIPFGTGRRICPGISFAMLSLHLSLASLIQGFELSRPSDEPIDMTESQGITNMKEKPLDVLLTPRLSPNMYI